MGRIKIALAVCSVLFVGASVWMLRSAAAPNPSEPCTDMETRERMRALMYSGVDQALTHHTLSIFETWMKDPTAQPQRARTGMQNAISAYLGAREHIDRWNPPPC